MFHAHVSLIELQSELHFVSFRLEMNILDHSAMVGFGSLDLGALTNLLKTADTTTISRLSRTSHFYKTACHSVLTDRFIVRAAELARIEEAARAGKAAANEYYIAFVNRSRESRGLPPLRPSEIDSDSESEGGTATEHACV